MRNHSASLKTYLAIFSSLVAFCSFIALSISSIIAFSFLIESESFLADLCCSSRHPMYHLMHIINPSPSYSSSPDILAKSRNLLVILFDSKSLSGPQYAQHKSTACLICLFCESSINRLVLSRLFLECESMNNSKMSLSIDGSTSLVTDIFSLSSL